MSDRGMTARRTSTGFVLSITFDDAEAFHDAAELLEERLIGSVPGVYTRAEAALWSAEDRPLYLLPSITAPQQITQEHELPPPEGEAEMDKAVDRYQEWESSPEGRAALDKAESFAAYRANQGERRQIAYTAWLENYGQKFDAARVQWQHEWSARIRQEFDALDG